MKSSTALTVFSLFPSAFLGWAIPPPIALRSAFRCSLYAGQSRRTWSIVSGLFCPQFRHLSVAASLRLCRYALSGKWPLLICMRQLALLLVVPPAISANPLKGNLASTCSILALLGDFSHSSFHLLFTSSFALCLSADLLVGPFVRKSGGIQGAGVLCPCAAFLVACLRFVLAGSRWALIIISQTDVTGAFNVVSSLLDICG
ncbi:hypothetical protein BKA70DRAFT_801908 [Coprinopsis sp. MPI-PUGE-AT-0042]|nr:hypothetical protein BKA70DRAFT_801908 [Coprinopsis sp. MPI-PUGE-AT-0042]